MLPDDYFSTPLGDQSRNIIFTKLFASNKLTEKFFPLTGQCGIFSLVFNISVSSTQGQIFVIARVFDVMQFDIMLQKCFNCSYRGITLLLTRTIEPSTHWTFTCSNLAI